MPCLSAKMKNVSDKSCRENQNAHFVFRALFSKNLAVYKTMWNKKIVERGRPQMTVWWMRIACWILRAINTLRICNTYFFSTATMAARTHLSVMLYVHCLSCPRSVDFTCHLSYSCWATVSSASSRTLQRTQSVLNCWVWPYTSRES